MILPETFIKRTKNLLGDEFWALKQALESNPPTSIRVNDKMEYIPSNERVDWCEKGYYLKERPLFTADPLFHAGVYYVQDASSMFLYQAVKQHFSNASKVLDLCAAPGGKSTLLTQYLPVSCLLVSNEIIRSRAYILAENIIKWGDANVIVTNNEAKDFAEVPGFFDAIVIDAPCSGEGMFRKDAGAIQEWSEYNVRLCVQRQRKIVAGVWEALKTEGILVYCTCTFNREENEENVQWICENLGAELLKIDVKGNHDITITDFGYRFYPHKTKGEGFFLTVLQKKSEISSPLKNKKDIKKGIKSFNKIGISPLLLIEPERWITFKDNNSIKAYYKKGFDDFMLIENHLKCMHSGILLGEIKGTDFIPSVCTALSKEFDIESCENVEVDYKNAISYLRKEAIQLPQSKRGYILVCYKSQPIGWVKNVGSRCNNLYPQEWRIRMKI